MCVIYTLKKEGNKCFELDKKFGFVNEQQFALQDDWNEVAMYQKLYHVALKHDKPEKGNAKAETHTMNEPFEKETDFDSEVSLIEEAIQSSNNVWDRWTDNGNSEMDAVAQANGIDKNQLSKGHRKQQQKRISMVERISNLRREMEERVQLNENGIQSDTVWLHDLSDRSSVTRTQMCSLKVPTAASWSKGSCNGPVAPFRKMWTQYGSFDKLEVSHDLWETDRHPDDTKLVFCGKRSSVTLYKQKRKRNSTTLQLLGENSVVATENDVSESREQNVAQQLSSKRKPFFNGFTDDTEKKRKIFSRRNVENHLYLLIMMMDDSTIFQEGQIQSRIMGQLENEFCLTCLPHGQSILMRKRVAEQTLENWLKTF